MNATPPGRTPLPLTLDPGLNVLRLAALTAGPDGALDAHTLSLMADLVGAGAVDRVPARQVARELTGGLLAPAPSHMLRTLRECGALERVLPELDALFGVPQAADHPAEVDVGRHQLRVVDEAARCGAPLAVRWAALFYNLGKADSPPEHLPTHYKHVERACPRINAICDRLELDADTRDLALLAVHELERVHKAVEMRAGAITLLLERVEAFARPDRFEHLLTLCTCDYRAFPGHAQRSYPKAPLLRQARQACLDVDTAAVVAGLPPEAAATALLEARTDAVARALQSTRSG